MLTILLFKLIRSIQGLSFAFEQEVSSKVSTQSS